MPKFESYPAAEDLADVDTLLVFQQATASVRQSSVSELAAKVSSFGLLNVPTVAALEVLSLTGILNDQPANVLGYAEVGDGGGGQFYYDEDSVATVNGGTVLSTLTGVGRWLRVWSGPLDVRWFGAFADGTTDVLSKILDVVVTAGPGGEVYLPAGESFYLISGTIEVTFPISFKGDGQGATIVKTSSPSFTMFELATPVGLGAEISSMCLDSTVTRTAGQAILIDGGDHISDDCTLRDLLIRNQFIGINLNRAAWTMIDHVTIRLVATNGIGILINDIDNVDAGENTLSFCHFDPNNNSGTTGVIIRSGGGLRVIGCKFLQGNIGLHLTSASGLDFTSGQLIVTGSSFDGQIAAGIKFSNANTGDRFGDTVISGNVFSGGCTDAFVSIGGSLAAIFSRITITSNSFQTPGAGLIAVKLSGCGGVAVKANIFGGGATDTAINIASTCDICDYGLNLYRGFTTPVVNTSTTAFESVNMNFTTNFVEIGGGYAGPVSPKIRGLAAASLPAAGATQNGQIIIDITNNRLCYYSSGNRYYITGVSF